MEQRDIFPAGQSGLNAAAVERRLAGYAAAGRRSAESADGRPRGDHDLNPEFYEPGQALTRAAVLVPIVVREAGLTLLLTQRTDHLYDHAGQVSFPGGRIDAGDSGPEAAALRETEEEIGLSRERVRLIGRLDTYLIRTGFEVTPVVGLVTPPFDLAPDSFEVAEVFEVPLDFFLDPNNCERHCRLFEGKDRYFYAFPYGDHYIWGATAGMLINLAEVLGSGA
ncbi:MAG: CoA pyrophosphatase [Kiloniellales bacterium]